MSDINSSLPVRTESNGDVVVRVGDGTTPSQQMAVDSSGRISTKLDDGAGNAVTSQVNGAQRALDVGIDVAGVQIDPRAVRALTSTDVVTANQGTANTATNAWPTKITDGTNTAAVKAASTAATATDPALVVAVSPNSTLITKDLADGSVTPGTAGTFSLLSGLVGASTSPTLTAGQQVALQGDLSGNLKVVVNQPLPAGTNLLGAVNLDLAGSPVSATNPVPVVISGALSGTSVNNYNTVASVAAAASSNHTYTITTSKTFQGKKIHASSSGKLKAEVQISPDGTTFTTIFVAFNSAAMPSIDIDLDELVFLESGTSSAIRVIRTNLDKASQDVYSTISGTEV